ncbi:T9SS type A sorting domain-containing protein [Kordia algicida OT-1]|uniref:Serine hydroxymethyltransferase n=1 Tax=Kordia algicida OT-1 TaxID=391587 RepID=A9DZP2_9FLAO|nr:T9SS type A sorting domain-containing protein [Kordia algicida]EDP95747.1 serine hydroxymethyltransferase [Kordia algicida OT-1]
MKLKLLVLLFVFLGTNVHAFQQVVATVGEVELLDHNPSEALADKTPLLLVHGWQPYPSPASGNITIWNNLVSYIETAPNLSDYKIYYVRYTSNLISVEIISNQFRQLVEEYVPFANKQLTLIAHSMGGLVSKNFMYNSYQGSPLGGERVTKLITLGTPHHGSPMANGPIRAEVVNDVITENAIAFFDFELYENCDAPAFDTNSRTDLRWDNFDNLYTTTQYATEPNAWLVALNLNTLYDSKITAYVAYLKNRKDASFQYKQTSRFLEAFDISYVNDGIVPVESARFDGHTLAGLRFFEDYDHAQIAKGKSAENTLDTELFKTIENDLLSNAQGLQITPPGIFDIGSTPINTVKNVTFSVTNNSNVATSFSISNSPSNDFLVVNPGSIQNSLAVGETKTVNVKFDPTTPGEKFHNITIVNSLGNISKQIKGTALSEEVTSSLFDDDYFIGTTELGTEVYKTIEIKNRRHTTATVTLSGISTAADNEPIFEFVDNIENTFNLLPDESKLLTIRFSPTSGNLGLQTGFLNVTWSYPDISTPPPPGAISVFGLGTLSQTGDVTFDSPEAVNNYFQNIVNQNNGNVSVGDLSNNVLMPLQNLQTVQGDFIINNSNTIQNLQFIRDLVFVSGDLTISNTANLGFLDFIRLGSDGLDFIIQRLACPNVSAPTFLPENTTMDTDAVIDNLTLDNNQSLTDISGLQGVKRISGNLTITNNALLTNLDGFSNLEFVDGGTITITNNPNLTNFCGLNKLLTNSSFSGTINISGNDYNPTLQDFNDGNCDGETLNITETTYENAVSIYPNPTNDRVFIETETHMKEVSIYDSTGRFIQTQQLKNNQFSTLHLSKGIYLIQLADDLGNKQLFKLVKL